MRIGTNRMSETAETCKTCGPGPRAKILVLAKAPLACTAAPTLPSHADSLARVQIMHFRADGRDNADNLMTWNERIGGYSQIIVNEVQIRVANTTMSDAYVNFSRP